MAYQPTAANCYRWGIADGVVPEPSGGAHRDHDEAARLLGGYISRALKELQATAPADRKRQRRDRYRRIGAYREIAAGDLTAMAAGRPDNGASNGNSPS
jgi:acetyl-CoA carboxylase alpha subunit